MAENRNEYLFLITYRQNILLGENSRAFDVAVYGTYSYHCESKNVICFGKVAFAERKKNFLMVDNESDGPCRRPCESVGLLDYRPAVHSSAQRKRKPTNVTALCHLTPGCAGTTMGSLVCRSSNRDITVWPVLALNHVPRVFISHHYTGWSIYNVPYHTATHFVCNIAEPFSFVLLSPFAVILNSAALFRERTIPTERLPLVGKVTSNFCG
jgi:hypothetical protein